MALIAKCVGLRPELWPLRDGTFRRRYARLSPPTGCLAWGLFPLLYAAMSLSLAEIGWLAAIYPAVWSVGQLFTGALSDRTGRKWLIASGMWMQAAGIAMIALTHVFWGFACGAILLGAGHRHGVSNIVSCHRRRRPPFLARRFRWGLPSVARLWLCGRSFAGWNDGGCFGYASPLFG